MAEQHVAVLLMAYGSPNSLEEVGEYLRQVRGGRSPTPAEIERLRERYRRVGGQTPLLRITLEQADALQHRFDRDHVPARVHVGMKHWHPFIEETVKRRRTPGDARDLAHLQHGRRGPHGLETRRARRRRDFQLRRAAPRRVRRHQAGRSPHHRQDETRPLLHDKKLAHATTPHPGIGAPRPDGVRHDGETI